MKVESTRLIIVLVCLLISVTYIDGSLRRLQCRDFAGDRSNCQRFIRCFHNLRVLFTCASNTAYVPDLKTCVGKELVIDCNNSENRIDLVTNSNGTVDDNDEYPTIEADLDALEAPMQKSLSSQAAIAITSRQFGCSSYCQNQGVCVLVGQAITCRCLPGFIGTRCQVSQTAISTRQTCAEMNDCKNGAVCVDIPALGTHICNCASGWTGDLCDYPDTTTPGTGASTTATATATAGPIGSACPSNPCLNGAPCVTTPGGGFRCPCLPGFTGVLCETTVGSIGTGCGNNNPCLNSGVCQPTTNGYQCSCSGGFSGSNCQTGSGLAIRNSCQPNPCQNGGSCYLTQTGFACSCTTGYSGTCCDITLAASNPCINNPCFNSGTCQVVAQNTYRCICPSGLIGIRCEQRLCDPNPCLYGGVCLPYGDSFQCQCPPQYTGRCCELLVVTTPPPNPCRSQPCLNGGTCSATSATAFVCSCTSSYYGRCCEVRNYCQPNPCYNGGTCIATTNAYICQCLYPFTGSNCEMTLATRPPQPNCACVLCPCPTPTTMTANPCLPNPCQNNGGCSVVQNTAQCYCGPSFTGYYCEFYHKRSLTDSKCSNVTCLNGGKCYVDEDQPKCACPKPYFGSRCESMNRPRTCDPDPCGQHGQCISTNDGHKCLCKNGRTGVLCEEIIMPKNYRWCPVDCPLGTTCVYEGTTPKCRLLNAY